MNSIFIFPTDNQKSINKLESFLLPLLKEHSFSQIFLIHSPNNPEQVESYLNFLFNNLPNIQVITKSLQTTENTSFQENFYNLQLTLSNIFDNYFITTSFFLIDTSTNYIQSACLQFITTKNIHGVIINRQDENMDTTKAYELREFDLLSNPNQETYNIACESQPKLIDEILEDLDLIGTHPKFKQAVEIAEALAPHKAPVLIQGKTGTGKEGFAKLVHSLSNRQHREMIIVNCASLPESLAGSILFGHIKGAFTNAYTSQEGKIAQANHSTLFLDEIGELSLNTQAQLLRVLETGHLDTIGSTKAKIVDIRIIAATNRDLRKEVELGNFREDLFYRLRVGEIFLPSLEERRSDIPAIAHFILNKINKNLEEPKTLSEKTINYLQEQSWPGNIRDLKNSIEFAAIFSKESNIKLEDFSKKNTRLTILENTENNASKAILHEGFSLENHLSEIRKNLIINAIDKSKGNQSKAARLLGITPQAINKFIKKDK